MNADYRHFICQRDRSNASIASRPESRIRPIGECRAPGHIAVRALGNDLRRLRKGGLSNVRSRLFMATTLAGIAGATWAGTLRATQRFHVKRRLSLRCWIFGHEDWVRRTPGRLYLECLDCGRQTPGWTTSRTRCDEGASGGVQAISNPPDCSESDVIPSSAGRSGRSQQPANQHETPNAA